MTKNLKNGTVKNQKKLIGERRSTDSEKPVWVFTDIDRGGKFAFDIKRKDFNSEDFLEKMINYSNMTWVEIKMQTHDRGKSKHHEISYDELSFIAKKRVRELGKQDHLDSIFSFAFTNLIRIIGVRDKEKFYVLWYDPTHEVCPTHK